MKRLLLGLLLAAPHLGLAQTIDFTTDISVANGEATPTLTWSTEPEAADCLASGDWSGARGPSGVEVQPTITSSATYALTCSWGGLGSMTLSWTAPTENTNGEPLEDLIDYIVKVGTATGTYDQQFSVPGVETRWVVGNLPPGEHFAVVTARNSLGVESDPSNEVSKLIGSEARVEEVSVTVNPKPNPPTNLQVD